MKETTKVKGLPQEVLYLQRTPCFGKCPVYTLRILDDESAVFFGRQNVNHLGWFKQQLDHDQYKALIALADEADVWSMKDSYEGEIADAPSVGFRYTKTGRTKEISGNMQMPEKLVAIFVALRPIVESEKWVMLEEEPRELTQSKSLIENQLIVQLKDEVNGTKWVTKYEKQSMKILKKVAPSLNYWVVEYDQSKISPNDMLQEIKRDEQVVDAQYNRKVSSRNRE